MKNEGEHFPQVEKLKDWEKFWAAYVEAFVQPLQANNLLADFVTNASITGAYAEAWVRAMTRNMLGHRFRISTGTVIRSSDLHRGLKSVPQCDIIVWDPSEMPAVFESGEFALVPYFAARAIIEIKRTLSARKELSNQLKRQQELLRKRGPVLGVVVSHQQALFAEEECTPDWLKSYKNPPPLDNYTRDQQPTVRLLDTENKPDTVGIMAFIYFLAQVAGYTDRL